MKPTYLLAEEFSSFENEFQDEYCVRKKIRKDTVICRPDDDRNHSYYIISGVAVFYLSHESGKDKISTFRGEGTIFPLYYIDSGYNMENNLYIKALTDMEVIIIPKRKIKEMMTDNAAFCFAMTEAYCKYCSILLHDMKGQLFDSYVCRTCSFLYIYAKYMRKLCIRLSHEEIAQATGITRANVSRVISNLKKNGIIRNDKDGYEILNEEELLGFCSYELAA